ncbi:aminodeoxychorismate synthase component I [Shewanella cyperi]|uniref:aminodeoxychorismate synthase component I n=1 Tax=Shewanella cyperi TaxID=2814292 RepID=UPI001A951485|nr:aminodeoxychorismate synthase component I [Shewanella cyperi]QSX39253.1 aminodeoxychorismate synthase component I [Shewanella cyperi]
MFKLAQSRHVSAPLAVKTLDWDDSTPALFAHLAHLPWALLLDSADAPHEDARRDLICANPVASLSATETEAHLWHSDAVFEATLPATLACTDPLALLEQMQTALFPHAKPCSASPFAGGAAGAFSYDLGRTIEKLPSRAKDDIALPLMNIGFYDWVLVHDYDSNNWTLVHYLGEAALNETLSWLESLRSQTEPVPDNFKLTRPFAKQISFEQYRQKFDAVQSYLHSGDCYQINLTQRFSAGFEGDSWQAYQALRRANGAPFSAFMRLPQGSILSISPERFIRLDGRKIQTKPIKGTLPRQQDPALDAKAAETLKASPKDRAENLMIVDLLRNDMGKVASPGSVRVPSLFAIESFPAVHHLVSTVEAELAEGQSAASLLRAAFPGGSITGAPKIRAMEIIEELEPSRRSLYCGSMGYLSQSGAMDTSITIRTLVAADGEIHCWAGGGVVADSVVESEYQESFDKVSRILPLLERFLAPDARSEAR